MNKHTPGPWQFGHFGTDAFWIGPNETALNVAIVPHDCDEAREESSNNAALIASAPSLLSALELLSDEVSNYFQNTQQCSPWPKFFDGAMNNAYASINKAKGG